MTGPPGNGGNGASFNAQVEASAAYAKLEVAVRSLERQVSQVRAEMTREIKQSRQQVQQVTGQQTKELTVHLARIEGTTNAVQGNPMVVFGRFLQSGRGFLLTVFAAIGALGSAAYGINTLANLLHQYGIWGWRGH